MTDNHFWMTIALGFIAVGVIILATGYSPIWWISVVSNLLASFIFITVGVLWVGLGFLAVGMIFWFLALICRNQS